MRRLRLVLSTSALAAAVLVISAAPAHAASDRVVAGTAGPVVFHPFTIPSRGCSPCWAGS